MDVSRLLRRAQLWPALLVALAGVVAAGAILGLIHFRDQATGQSRTELTLANVRADANRLDTLSWEAISRERFLSSGGREARESTRGILAGLAELSGPDAGPLRDSFARYADALEEELPLIASSPEGAAERIDRTRVDPARRRFDGDLEAASETSAGAARRSIRIADSAAWAIGVFTAIALFGLFGLFYRNRRRSLAGELERNALEHQIELADRLARSREHDANYDMLTGLANRRLFLSRLKEQVDSATASGARVGVLLLDLDRFKEINDTLGHEAGDLLLRQVKPRLESVLRQDDVLARLGGDEFALLVPAGERVETKALCELAERVGEAMADPFDVQGLALRITASIGIAVFPTHGNDPETLLRHADVAMYRAKDERCGHALYAPEADSHSLEQLCLAGDLRGALDSGQLVVHYQPKAELDCGTIVGAEALIRWDHPARGLLLPGEFLAGAELSGLMGDLTRHVLDSAIGQIASWDREGIALDMAINLSAVDVIDRTLPAEVAAILAHHGVAADRLRLEITENLIMTDPVPATEVIAELARLGIRLSLDDFGTGHSSLAHLRRLDVHEVKIDRSFVTELSADAQDTAIVRSTIELAHDLDLNVVAEGIETEEAWEELRHFHCDEGQGFLVGRPVPAVEIAELLGKEPHRVLARS